LVLILLRCCCSMKPLVNWGWLNCPSRPTLAAQIPRGIPANSLGQSLPCQSSPGQILVLFGSPLTRGLQPVSLPFPRGNNTRANRPGEFPVRLRVARSYFLPLATPPSCDAAAARPDALAAAAGLHPDRDGEGAPHHVPGAVVALAPPAEQGPVVSWRQQGEPWRWRGARSLGGLAPGQELEEAASMFAGQSTSIYTSFPTEASRSARVSSTSLSG
jgi:hypothetical protein